MLYNKDWDNKKDVHSLDNLIDWLENQDPAKGYLYWNAHNCLLAQYYRAQGVNVEHMGSRYFAYHHDASGYVKGTVPEGFDAIAHGGFWTNTIGYALNRALKYRASLERTEHLEPSFA